MDFCIEGNLIDQQDTDNFKQVKSYKANIADVVIAT